MEEKKKRINIQILYPENESLHIEGKLTGKMYIENEKGDIIPLDDVTNTPGGQMISGAEKRYCIDLPLYSGASYSFCRKKKGEIFQLEPSYGKFSMLSNLKGSHLVHGEHIISAEGDEIHILKNALTTRLKLDHQLKKTFKDMGRSDVIELRKAAKSLKESSRPIWLVSDRSDFAQDNGIALFEYMMTNGADKDRDIYFMIGEESPDYERVCRIGPVIKIGTTEHKEKVLAATLIISSSGDDWVVNPFGKEKSYYRDIATAKFVFLQHGIIKDDLSGWLNRFKKNPAIFITSARGEYESILNGDYGYDKSVVKLTGLARYDKLNDEKKKIISILPTWRKELVPPLIPGTSERPHVDEFVDSEYFRFYNELINDPRLTTVMKEYGYTGYFYMHPNHINQACDFQGNDIFSVSTGKTEYSKVFRESALLVTDYSSVAIDFAYLKKPVVYAQFDKKTFYETHSYVEGYYDYERDGFGPVCYDFDDTVATMIRIIESGCREEEMYEERIGRFFAYTDRGNCQRIYEEIVKL